MRKHLKTLLAICLILSLVCQIQPSTAVAYDDSFDVSGYTMSEDYYKAAYGSNLDDRKEILATRGDETKTSADMRISNVEVKDDAIYLSLNMGTGGKNIMIGGKLYKSAMTQHGVNSIVVDAKCTNTSYDILLFEIWNDSAVDHQIMYNTSLKNTPHVKLYLQNTNGDISAFEFPLPAALTDLEASDYAKADSAIDLLWPMKVVDVTVTEVPTNDAILEKLGLLNNSRAANTWTTWTDSRTYFLTFTNLNQEYTSISLPYIDYRYTNVTSSGGTWIASFEVAEHTSTTNAYGDPLDFHGDNAFRYRNVKLAFAAGDNTTFIRTYRDGRVVNSNNMLNVNTGAQVAIKALRTVVSAYSTGLTYFDLIDVLEIMASTDQTVRLGSNGITLLNSMTVATGEQLASNYYISECTDQDGVANVGDYFTYHADLLYENAGGSASTLGMLYATYDVCVENQNASGYPKSRTAKIQINYTSNP